MSVYYSGWPTVIPGPGKARETARELLALADDPADVVSQKGGAEFLVAPYIHDRLFPAAPKRVRRTKKEGD